MGSALLLALIGCSGEIRGGGGDDPDPDAPDAAPGSFDAAPGSPDEPAALAGITQRHNEVRATVGVAPLVWDPELAAVAQAWADQCVDNQPPAGLIDHNDGRSDTYPGYVGENIYGSSGAASPIAAVDAWASEAENYDYGSNTCSGVCGHYTQVVWAESLRLGCGISSCAGLTFGSSIVCNYSPGGNNGDRPY